MKSRYVLVEERGGSTLHNTGGGNINFIAYEGNGNYHKVVVGYNGMEKPRVQSFGHRDTANEFINLLTEGSEVVAL